jgi:predicted secreted protein
MKPSHKAIAAFIFILIVSCSATRSQKTAMGEPQQTANITEANAGQTLTVSKGQVFTLTLADKVDGGYRTDKAQFDTTVLQLQNYVKHPPEANSSPGTPGHDVWQFAAIKEGNCELKVTASRSFQSGSTITLFSNTVVVKGE